MTVRHTWRWGLLAIVLVVGACSMFNAPIDAAKAFLALIGEGKYAEAHSGSAREWRDRQPLDAFTTSVRRLGLDRHDSSYFNNVKINNDIATVRGVIRFKGGGESRVAVGLKKEGDRWRVYRIRVERPGAARGKPI